ncbi:MAG: M23 family metallopeptidase [Pseudonocardiaceae bacterium]
MVVAAVAAGAFAAATAGHSLHNVGSSNTEVTPLASSHDAAGLGFGGDSPIAAPEVLRIDAEADAGAEVRKLTESQQVTKAREQREAEAAREAAEEAARPKFVKPAIGALTSMFGARWGTSHYGIDIAGPMGSPIYSVADGTVLEAGPAAGFGLWVRVQHDDGTVTVYGHMNSFSVSEGERVKAGEQIAEIGNRGQSTGPHLHFEVWQGENGMKIDPLSWLAEHGVDL